MSSVPKMVLIGLTFIQSEVLPGAKLVATTHQSKMIHTCTIQAELEATNSTYFTLTYNLQVNRKISHALMRRSDTCKPEPERVLWWIPPFFQGWEHHRRLHCLENKNQNPNENIEKETRIHSYTVNIQSVIWIKGGKGGLPSHQKIQRPS